MKNPKNLLFLFFFLVFTCHLSGFNFDGLTLSNDDRLLFKLEFEGQHSLFVSNLSDMSMQQLTVFPEKLYLVDNGRTILALNRFGAFRIPTSGGLPAPLPGYPSFAEGNIPLKGRLQDIAASNDGRWVLHIEPTSPGYGNLLLIDISSGVKRVISEKLELPGHNFPVKWSPDSRLFVYEKNGRLFYFPILNDLSALIDERFRMIGTGKIASVLWADNGDFYYITDNTLYRVMNPELFTRTIYGDFLSIGRVAAVLPVEFDPGFDRYWVAPDYGSILINKGGKGLFFFLIGENSHNTAVLPHVSLPYGAENINVLWPPEGPVTIVYSIDDEARVLRFNVNRNTVNSIDSRTGPSVSNAALSPDGTRAIFWGQDGLELWDYTNWRLIQRLSREPVLSCAWVNNRLFITGNLRFIEEINITSSSYPRRRICLAGAEVFGFEESAREPWRILAQMGNTWFASDGINSWVQVNNAQLRQASFSSDRFRVFSEPQASGHFRNIPMIRNLQSTGTLSLVSRHTANSVYSPERRLTQIALCFDLYDDDTGLTQVLTALNRHNFKATFFLNGEFIRRNPLATAAIANAGHEAASLFYAPIDLSDTRYRITRDFIAQGLARNEDEFYRATGKELSILWHPPYYRSSSLINSAASSTGYITVTRSIDPGDWLSRDDTLRLNLHQTSPSEIIEQIMEKAGAGAIIPVRLGLLPGGRDEYLFQRIEVLLDVLIRSGYEVVPVTTVIR
ncbi:MAG: polysaccharide deacetylase family protein [Treponema sp.]|nr:polysaccharide deacetylase family protein [Treponema sp.]